MNWQNLKENKCPNCSKAFNYRAFSAVPNYIKCPDCSFIISNHRMEQIVNSQITQDLQDKWNLEFE